MMDKIAGIEIRNPFKSELDYFERNPKVAGMAASDNKIIINPFSGLMDEQKRFVAINEAARVWMRTKDDFKPNFELTQQQKDFLDTTDYAGASDQDRMATIAARILSGDPSAGQPTPEQMMFVMDLKRAMFGE